jgi:hypothetical protein
VKERVAAANGTGEARQGSASACVSVDEALLEGASRPGSSKRGDDGAERGLIIANSGGAKERPSMSADRLA